MEGEYVIVLGIKHTVMATWQSVYAEGRGFDPQPGQKVISTFFIFYKTILTHAKDRANFILFTFCGLRG